MNRIYISIICFLFAASAHSQPNGQIISSKAVSYPDYEKIKDIPVYYDKDSYVHAITSNTFKTEKLVYFSEGLKVVAYLTLPNSPVNGKKYPVIIFNRGSYIRNDIAFVHAPLFQKLVDSGFVVIAPALRESEGGEGKDEMGGKDLKDIWNILPFIKANDHLDTANIFMYGESRGGVMTLEMLRDKFPLNAAATVGAFTDFETFINENPGLQNLCRQIWPQYEKQKDSIFRERSAIRWAGQIITPVLLMAGSADKSVNPQHTIELAKELNALHKDYELMILNGGNHILSGNLLKNRDTEIIHWFKLHLH